MASEAKRSKLYRALDRVEKSNEARRRAKEWHQNQLPKDPDAVHFPTSFEVPNSRLRELAHGCPTPILLCNHKAPAGERIKSIPCGRWTCRSCGPKRCAEFSRRTLLGVMAALEERHLANECQEETPHEWTLTFRPEDLPGDPKSREQMAGARKAWNRLRRAVAEGRRRQGLPSLIYLSVREYTKRGVPHFHVLCIGNPWPVSVPHRDRPSSKLASRAAKERGRWLEQFGFGFVHTWEPVRDARAIGYYLTDYITKAASMAVPKHCPRYSSSRGFAPSLHDWRAVRAHRPAAFDLPGERKLPWCSVGDIDYVSIDLVGRFWLREDWKPFVEAVKVQARYVRAFMRAPPGKRGAVAVPPPESLGYLGTLSTSAV